MEVGASRQVLPSSARPSSGRGDLGVLGRAAALAAPVTLAGQQVLPVLPALAELLPTGLRRGSALAVIGDAAVSMALAVAAAASADGAWLAVVGLPGVGLGAAAGFGVALDRFVVVDPGSSWPAVLGVVVDGFDLVIVRPPRTVPLAAWRRATARLRERGGVLLAIDPPATFEVSATISTTASPAAAGSIAAGSIAAGSKATGSMATGSMATGSKATGSMATGSMAAGWVGVNDGAGSLRSRTIVASIGGRGAMARVRRSVLCLPGPTGAVLAISSAAETASVEPLVERAVVAAVASAEVESLRSAG